VAIWWQQEHARHTVSLLLGMVWLPSGPGGFTCGNLPAIQAIWPAASTFSLPAEAQSWFPQPTSSAPGIAVIMRCILKSMTSNRKIVKVSRRAGSEILRLSSSFSSYGYKRRDFRQVETDI